MDSEISQNCCPLDAAAKSVFVMSSSSLNCAVDNSALSPAPTLSPLITKASRPILARASTTATLVHVDIDIVSRDSLQRPTTDGLKSVDLIDCSHDHISSKSVAPAEDGNLDQDATIVNVASPPAPLQRRGGNKRAAKNMAARWTPNPLERGIRANRPATGIERLACLRRLTLAI